MPALPGRARTAATGGPVPVPARPPATAPATQRATAARATAPAATAGPSRGPPRAGTARPGGYGTGDEHDGDRPSGLYGGGLRRPARCRRRGPARAGGRRRPVRPRRPARPGWSGWSRWSGWPGRTRRSRPAPPRPARPRPEDSQDHRPGRADRAGARLRRDRPHLRPHRRTQSERGGDQPGRHDPLRRRQVGAGPGRLAEPDGRPADHGARARPVGRPGRGEPQLLHRPRHLAEGHHPGRVEQRARRRPAGRLDDHPAVREERLHRRRPHVQAEVPGAVRHDQAGPAVLEGPDPRVVPEHDLLRPRRVRHPGRVPGLLRQARVEADGRRGRRARLQHPVAGALRPAGAPGGGEGPLALRAQRHGHHAEAVRRGRGEAEVPGGPEEDQLQPGRREQDLGRADRPAGDRGAGGGRLRRGPAQRRGTASGHHHRPEGAGRRGRGDQAGVRRGSRRTCGRR